VRSLVRVGIMYYRRFVENLAGVASPLCALMRNGVRFEWMAECHEAFEASSYERAHTRATY